MREVSTTLSGAALPEVPGDASLEDRIGLEVSLFRRHSTLSGETTYEDVGQTPHRQVERPSTASKSIKIGWRNTIDDQWSRKPLRLMSPIDLRSGFDIPEHVGLSLSIAITSFERDNTTFWDEVHRIHQQIAKFRERKMALWMVGDIAKRCIEDPSYDATRRRVLEHSPSDSNLTNFRVLGMPTHFGDLVVEKIWAPALRSVPGQDAVAAATFDGVLSLVHTSVAGTDGLLARLVEIMEDA